MGTLALTTPLLLHKGIDTQTLRSSDDILTAAQAEEPIVTTVSPALLQSTVKLFFCPTAALDRPVPRHTTMLASDASFDEVVEEDELEL
ncbi:hypothetical protein EYF80_007737 [Liparis tanakae]|uniref:Uncharacterized protein n=1 Tax=Liparis tanakae TaxID=230148 RepID=A0A4Z2IW90_9TELE|nr:hypothetical protein EYF80_007737 [Liparis tanakae]